MRSWPITFSAAVMAVQCGVYADDEAAHRSIASELRQRLGHEFRVHASARFVVIYDTDEAFARRRAGLLERTHDQFYHTFEKIGLSPQPIERRLVCLLFREFDDYARYAAAADGQLLAYTGGYFSLETGRIAFHDDRTSPQLEETTRRMDDLETQIALLQRRVEELRRSRGSTAADERRLAELRREHRWLGNRLDVIAAGSNDAKTMHEAVHQLAFGSSLQNPAVQYPLWVTEGMATNFESSPTTGPIERAAPYSDNPSRRKLLVESHMRGELTPLAKFIAITQVPEEAEHRRAAELYAYSWGLFRFLFTRRNEQLRDYLQALAAAAPGPRDSAVMLSEFEAAFGPAPRMERDFSAYLRSIR